MNPPPPDGLLTCEDAHRAIHKRCDGLPAAESGSLLDAHLAACKACRQYSETLATIQKVLGSLPAVPFPDQALESVWDRTIRHAEQKAARARWSMPARGLGLAAMIALSVLGSRLLFRLRPAEPSLSQEELARLAAETRLVFELTNTALRHVENAAIDGVIVEGITPALKRIQVSWIRTTEDQPGRTGT